MRYLHITNQLLGTNKFSVLLKSISRTFRVRGKIDYVIRIREVLVLRMYHAYSVLQIRRRANDKFRSMLHLVTERSTEGTSSEEKNKEAS